MADENIDVYERILALFQHLDITRAHVASHQWPGDWQGLASERTDLLASLTLAGGLPPDTAPLEALSVPLFVFCGDAGSSEKDIRKATAACSDARLLLLTEYSKELWDDIVADRTNEVAPAFEAFLERANQQGAVPNATCKEGEGTCAGIRYQVRGSGPALVLFPLGLAKSQWEPLLERLSARYCTITVQGPHLGPAAVLEGRAKTSGYLDVVGKLADRAQLEPGNQVLEVGCGTGAITRWLAASRPNCSFTGIDVNTYLLAEATALATANSTIQFKEGNAESLPFSEASFDVALSFTVLEELDVDRALAEMVRVMRPGGRVGVLVRSVDTHVVVNLPLRPELRQKVEAPPLWWGGVGEKGCADRSLYRRFLKAGLTDVEMLPQLATYTDTERLEGQYPQFAALLDPEEVDEWWQAVKLANAEGTAFISQPFHSAVGIKT